MATHTKKRKVLKYEENQPKQRETPNQSKEKLKKKKSKHEGNRKNIFLNAENALSLCHFGFVG